MCARDNHQVLMIYRLGEKIRKTSEERGGGGNQPLGLHIRGF